MISTKGRYALRVMIDLAEQNSAGYIPLNEIATRQQISEKYLEIILKVLVKNKLLEGQRGKGGGYRLTRPINEYTAGEILELTEGSLSSVACLAPDAPPCERQTSQLRSQYSPPSKRRLQNGSDRINNHFPKNSGSNWSAAHPAPA